MPLRPYQTAYPTGGQNVLQWLLQGFNQLSQHAPAPWQSKEEQQANVLQSLGFTGGESRVNQLARLAGYALPGRGGIGPPRGIVPKGMSKLIGALPFMPEEGVLIDEEVSEVMLRQIAKLREGSVRIEKPLRSLGYGAVAARLSPKHPWEMVLSEVHPTEKGKVLLRFRPRGFLDLYFGSQKGNRFPLTRAEQIKLMKRVEIIPLRGH